MSPSWVLSLSMYWPENYNITIIHDCMTAKPQSAIVSSTWCTVNVRPYTVWCTSPPMNSCLHTCIKLSLLIDVHVTALIHVTRLWPFFTILYGRSIATRDFRFSLHRPSSTDHRSRSTVHRQPFTVHRAPFTVHCSPSTVHRPLFTFHRPT